MALTQCTMINSVESKMQPIKAKYPSSFGDLSVCKSDKLAGRLSRTSVNQDDKAECHAKSILNIDHPQFNFIRFTLHERRELIELFRSRDPIGNLAYSFFWKQAHFFVK